MNLRLDLPPDVNRARTELYGRIMELLAFQTYEAAQEANRLHTEWLRAHPNDYIALDAGEVVSKTLAAFELDLPDVPPVSAGSARVAVS